MAFRLRLIGFLAVGLALTAAPSSAQLTLQAETLTGLPGVYTSVSLGDVGFTVAELQTELEVQLRAAGIKQLSHGECTETPSQPFLLLSISAVKNQLNARVTRLDFRLLQKVQLWNGQACMIAVTWQQQRVIAVSPDVHSEQVREMVRDAVRLFVNDWQMANPKQ